MSNTFTYSWTSQSATEYLKWLEGIQEQNRHRRRCFAWIAALVFIAGLIEVLVVVLTNTHASGMLIALGTSLLSGFLMTDTCRGKLYCDLVGAVIKDFSSMSEFDIGRFEKNSTMLRNDEEEKNLLYCLRITSNLSKYKKIDVMVSRWKSAMEHGRPYFCISPRGKLTFDFLTQIYFFYIRRAFTDYAAQQYTAIANLKTETAKQNRLKKAKSKLVEILTQNHEFPQMQELVNATYRAIAKAVKA